MHIGYRINVSISGTETHSTAPAHYSTVQGYHPNANGEAKQAWSLYRVKITLPPLIYYYNLQAFSALILLVVM